MVLIDGLELGPRLGCSDGLVLGSKLGLHVLPDFAFAPRQSSLSLDLDTTLLPLVETGALLPLARGALLVLVLAVATTTALIAVSLHLSNTLVLMVVTLLVAIAASDSWPLGRRKPEA